MASQVTRQDLNTGPILTDKGFIQEDELDSCELQEKQLVQEEQLMEGAGFVRSEYQHRERMGRLRLEDKDIELSHKRELAALRYRFKLIIWSISTFVVCILIAGVLYYLPSLGGGDLKEVLLPLVNLAFFTLGFAAKTLTERAASRNPLPSPPSPPSPPSDHEDP